MFFQFLVFLLSSAWAASQATTTVPPTVSLPWNTYTPTLLPKTKGNADIYMFQNVRFGDAPTGSMRFGAPSTPTAKPPPDPTGFIQCHQVNLLSSGKKGLGIPFFGAPNAGGSADDVTQTEDCLFLDIYAPASVFNNGSVVKNVPVIVWFYGGAYVGGSKLGPDPNNPLYNGVGAINAAKNFGQDVIFVVGNYRLGAYGWLAGSYMEKVGRPNAGLFDQRLLLQWVQNYIGQVGGDRTKVSAWGESAGAGSILHHLVLYEGNSDPLFNRAILQSPAYELEWDRTGTLNSTYTKFISSVPGCQDTTDINCLRSLPIDDDNLVNANQDYTVTVHDQTGLIPFGPAVDGSAIKHLPANEFANNLFFSKLDSIMVSHVGDEARIFVPSSATTNEYFTTFVSNFMPEPSLSDERASIASKYPPDAYPSPKARMNALIRDASFTCNTRQLFDAYHGIRPTYMLYYNVDWYYGIFSIIPPLHGTDLAPTFWNPEVDFAQFLIDVAEKAHIPLPGFMASAAAKFYADFAPKYQSYLVAHAIFGDPNKGSFTAVPWPTATPTVGSDKSTSVGNVQQAISAAPQFQVVVDEINTSGACDFWRGLAAKIDPINKGKMEECPEEDPEQVVLSDNAEKYEL